MAKHKSLIIIFCIFSFFFFNIIPSTSANNVTDMLSLLAFKASITDDPLGALSSWNQTTHFCTWKGVTCGKRHSDRVVSINLRSQGLFGSLSPHLGNLSFLRRIILQNNSFYGPIPDEIGRLRRLEYAELSNNTFGGEIPRNITQCNNVYYLNLNGNNLTGVIFPEIGSMLKLEALGLSINRLSGTIPPSIGNLSSLFELSLADCGLEGEIPESFVNLRKLSFFQLSQNSLTGHIPSGLFNISAINSFTVMYNKLEGTVPQDIGLTLPNLNALRLSNNYFTGEIPRSLSNATNLVILNLSWNNFTGPILNNLEKLTNLENFLVQFNNIWGDFSFISSLTNCKRLGVLAVEQTLLNGSIPDSIANLSSQLTYLSLFGNQIHGNIPPGIGNLVGLNFLRLANNYLSGPIPSSIGKLVGLQGLDLGGNMLTSEIPNSIGNLNFLNLLNLSSNSISGSIPQSLGNCRTLLTLDLSGNNLNGPIPREILNLSSISIIFSLGHNALTGTIPSEVGMLRNLVALDLSNNNFSGSIPSSLSTCESLEDLNLEGNLLEGSIPEGLSALNGLEILDLSRNQLSGPVPNFLAEMNLSYLNLSFNRLQGLVPTQGIFRNASAFSLAGNEDLCGGIPELKLHACPSSNPQKKKFPKVLLIVIPILVVVAASLVVSILIFFYKKGKFQIRKSKISVPALEIGQFLRLSYGDLLKATDGFSEENLIGSGRFGSVYKGKLSDEETMVAVKVLNLNVRGATKTFIAECNALREIRHRNLLKVLSICVSTNFRGEDFKALIYEYKPQGSLDKWLHHQGSEHGDVISRMHVTMIQRLNIAVDVASALEYLHFGTDSTVIHGDVKPSNILLDDDMTAHVGDFGLAKVISNLNADVLSPHQSNSTAVRGTIGYIAPEYGMEGTISTQGDAYSFGILLLEMFTCKRPTDDEFNDRTNLHSFVSSALPSRVMDIVDPKITQLESDITDVTKIEDCMILVLGVGLKCSMELPRERMSMKDAVIELKKARTAFLAR